MGSCQMQITRSPCKLKKETIPLASVPAPFFSKPPNSRITVFYHIVERLEDQPDLVELARRLGDDATEQQKPQNMTVRCCCLQVRRNCIKTQKRWQLPNEFSRVMGSLSVKMRSCLLIVPSVESLAVVRNPPADKIPDTYARQRNGSSAATDAAVL